MRVKIGMGQMRVKPGNPAANLARAVETIEAAARSGCDVVVLPECLDLGWMDPRARELAEPVPGERSDRLARAAAKAGIHVVAGLTERDGERIYNSSVLVSPAGELLRRHRKINELDIALELYSRGDSVAVAHTALGTVGVSICADNFPETPMFAESMALMGARLILSPCAWAVDPDHDNEREPYGDLWMRSYTRLARAHDMTIVGVSYVGPISGGAWKGHKCIGCSLAVGPGGEVLARGPYGEEALICFETAATQRNAA
jgi:predicted amidohydrolase